MPLDTNIPRELPAAVIGARLRAARRQARLTLREVGKALGVSTAMVCNYESGHSRMSPQRIAAVCQALNLDMDELLRADSNASLLLPLPLDQQNQPWTRELLSLLQMVDQPELQNAMMRLVQTVARQPVTPRHGTEAVRPAAAPVQPSAQLAAELQADMVRSGAGLQLHYQPIIGMGGEVSGFEALVRWTTAADVTVPVQEVLALAQDHGFAEALDFWVIQEACTDATSWRTAERPLGIALNLTGSLLRSADCVSAVEAVLGGSQLPPRQLCLEVPEALLLDESVIANLRGLQQLGLRLAIDNFGAGQASLARLLDLKVDVVKLDPGFFSRRQLDRDGLAFLKAIVAMAQQAGCLVLAKGIETAEDATLAREMGCDACQGNWYAEPLTPAAVRAALSVRDPRWQQRGKAA